MDNITAPQGGSDPSQGAQPQPGAGSQPDPNDPGATPGQPPAGGEGASLQMPPDLNNQGNQEAGAAQPAPNPSQGQGQVEDVLEGTEGGANPGGMGGQPDASSGLPSMGSSPDQAAGEPTPGQPPAGDGGMMSPDQQMGGQPEQPVTPQGQPDFSGSAGDGGMMPPNDPNAMPGQQMPQNQPPKSGSKLMPIILVVLLIVVLAGVSIAYFMNLISLPFLDNLLGRNQQAEQTAETTPTDQTANQFPEDQQRKNDLAQVKSALEEYFTETQKYPISKTVAKVSESTSVVYKALVPKYLDEMPADPSAPTKYYGYRSADGTSFELTAVLDNTSDTEGIKRGNYTFYVLTNNSAVETQTETTGTETTTETTNP